MLLVHQLSLKNHASCHCPLEAFPDSPPAVNTDTVLSTSPLLPGYCIYHLLEMLANQISQFHSSLENFLQPNGSPFFPRAGYSKLQIACSSNQVITCFCEDFIVMQPCSLIYTLSFKLHDKVVAKDTKEPRKPKTFTFPQKFMLFSREYNMWEWFCVVICAPELRAFS